MTIVVLGGGIDEEHLPSQVKKRLEKAISIFKSRGADRFLLCGKYSFLFDSETPEVTEAQLMKYYLIESGIDEENICLEEKSMDTISNAYFAKTEYFLPEREKDAVVVSSNYHIPRVRFIFKKMLGEDYNLEFEGIKTDSSEKLIERQKELLEEMKELTEGMADGDHKFFKDKFFNIDYYKRKRPSWIKNKTSKGDIKNEN